MNQQLMVRLVPRHTLQMRFFLILAQPLKAHFQLQKGLNKGSLGFSTFEYCFCNIRLLFPPYTLSSGYSNVINV